MNRDKRLTLGRTAQIMTVITLLLSLALMTAGCVMLIFPGLAGSTIMSTIFGNSLFGTSCRILAYGICFALGTDIAERRRENHI